MLETSELSRIMSASIKFYPLGETVLLELSDNELSYIRADFGRIYLLSLKTLLMVNK